MISTLILFALLSIGFLQGTLATNESCDVRVYNAPDTCRSVVSVPYPCDSATLNLAATNFTSCNAVSLSWSYPMNNLTIIIETPFTHHRKPYIVNMGNSLINAYDILAYRIIDGQETEIKTPADLKEQKSDSNYQVILKLQAPSTIGLYVLFFNYKVIKF